MKTIRNFEGDDFDIAQSAEEFLQMQIETRQISLKYQRSEQRRIIFETDMLQVELGFLKELLELIKI